MSNALYITRQLQVEDLSDHSTGFRLFDLTDVVAAATGLRRRIDPHLSRTTGRDEWSYADLLALALIAREELARQYDCEARIFYKKVEFVPQPLIRLTRGESVVDLDMAADRMGPEAIRAEAGGGLYRDVPDTTLFLSADSYNEIYQDVTTVAERVGVRWNGTED